MKYYDIFSKKSIVITLLVLGVLTHAAWFGHPNSAVFDEVHFGKFISAYFTHEYYFDIHPPLGKLVLAAWGWLWGFKPGFSFANIGEVYPDNLYMALRFLPMLAGALLPLVIFGVARQLKLSLPASALAGILVALDNALLVQSRLILLDPFLLLFGFSALWCYLKSSKLRASSNELSARDSRLATLYLLSASLLGGAAMSIKWTGITFLGLIIILEALRLWSTRHDEVVVRGIGPAFASLVVLPLLLYAAVFTTHFALLTKTGAGDAFMSARFQGSLAGSRYAGDTSLQSIGPLEKTVELNTEMYRSNRRLSATHPYSSKWYTWPLMARPIFYWVKDTARIYLIGNPVVWWGSSVAVLVMFMTLAFSGVRSMSRTPLILAGAWLMNIVPFIGISRVMFLYHYFTALIWAILMLAYLVDRNRHTRKTVIGISCAALALFIYFAPLSYGLPLTDSSYNNRVWFSSWR